MHHYTRHKKLKCLYSSTSRNATTKAAAAAAEIAPTIPLRARVQMNLMTIIYCVVIEVFTCCLLFFTHIKKLQTQ